MGAKCSTDQKQPDDSTKVIKEYLWVYGSGIVSAITADYGDVVLADETQPLNEGDVTYYRTIHQETVNTLNQFTMNATAYAIFYALYAHETYALHG